MSLPFEVEPEFSKQKIHFTYKTSPDMSSLCQGDVLKPTEELKNVLRDIHPYFLNEQYKYFLVLTQSCDLVRRDGSKCKTPYITLAAITSFDDFYDNCLKVNKYAEEVNGFLLMDTKQRERAYQLLERLYNNTEPDCFFLYKEDAFSFPNSMVASLKVSIALKSALHYDVCLNSKVLELSDEFKAKLGWLVGNIYSRVGTTDWESIMTKNERKQMLSNELSSHCIIGSKAQIKELKNELKTHAETIKTQEDANDFISSIHIDSQYDMVMNIISDQINMLPESISEDEKTKLLTSFKSSSQLKVLLSNNSSSN